VREPAYILVVPMTDASSGSNIPSELRPTLPPWARATAERIHHIQRVAELVALWGDRMGTPDSERNRWFKAVWLHDALRDADEDELSRWAAPGHGPVELRHGPAAASRAKAEGETDRGVLDAVRYHSLGLAEWDMVGRVLYCADFLEPGRSFDRAERAELTERFPADPKAVLLDVARRRILHTIRSGWTLTAPTVRFWNSLADTAPSR
jgi:HD superfamily phosphohydrolase YqeK